MNKGKIEINRGATPAIPQSGVGYIVIPVDDNEREQYINNCFRTNMVMIQGGYGSSYIGNVKVVGRVMQELKFPQKNEERGSIVFWIRENFTNRPIIVGIIKDEDYTNLLHENQYRIVQQTEDGITVEIFEDANECMINVVANGDSSVPANIKIKANSGNSESVIRLETDGVIELSSNDASVIVRNGISVKMLDNKDEEMFTVTADNDTVEYNDKNNNSVKISEDGIEIETDNDVSVKAENSKVYAKCDKLEFETNTANIKTNSGFKLDNGNEPMVLGNTLKGILNDLCTALTTITVTCPPFGGSSSVPINAAQFTAIAARLQTILSNKSKLD